MRPMQKSLFFFFKSLRGATTTDEKMEQEKKKRRKKERSEDFYRLRSASISLSVCSGFPTLIRIKPDSSFFA